jgi:hypothetical protein
VRVVPGVHRGPAGEFRRDLDLKPFFGKMATPERAKRI